VNTDESKLPEIFGEPMDAYDWLEVGTGEEWLVEGLVLAQSLTMVKGKRESGKSTLTMDFIRSYVMGEPEWLGRKILADNRGRVFYGVTDTNAEMEVSRAVRNLGIPRGRVQVQRIRRNSLNAETGKQLNAYLRASGFGLAVFDNGTGLVADIVKNEYTAPLFDGIKEIAGPGGLSVILVHHEPRGGASAAGNYSWEGESRWRMSISRIPGESLSSPERLVSLEGNAVSELADVVRVKMPRIGHPGSRFTLSEARNTVPEDRSKGQPVKADLWAKILSYGDREWASNADIADVVGTSEATVSRLLTGNGYKIGRKSYRGPGPLVKA
jgi:AAA domain